MKPDAIATIELGYDMTGTTAEWLERLSTAVYAQFGAGLGMQGFVYDLTPDHRIRVLEMRGTQTPDGMVEQTAASLQQMPPDFVRYSFLRCEAITQSRADPVARAHVRPVMEMLEATLGWRDLLIIGGLGPSNQGVYFGVALPERTKLSLRIAHDWTRVAVHLAAAYRLRRRLAEADASAESADAIFTPGGRLEHAQDEAQTAAARMQLATAVKETERARGRLRRREPERAINLWRGLVSSRWSLVDQFETDGKRYVLARRNDVSIRGLEALSARERQVISYAALGHTNKLIAYDMGLSDSTVRVMLHRAAKKLGVTTREEVVEMYRARVTPAER